MSEGQELWEEMDRKFWRQWNWFEDGPDLKRPAGPSLLDGVHAWLCKIDDLNIISDRTRNCWQWSRVLTQTYKDEGTFRLPTDIRDRLIKDLNLQLLKQELLELDLPILVMVAQSGSSLLRACSLPKSARVFVINTVLESTPQRLVQPETSQALKALAAILKGQSRSPRWYLVSEGEPKVNAAEIQSKLAWDAPRLELSFSTDGKQSKSNLLIAEKEEDVDDIYSECMKMDREQAKNSSWWTNIAAYYARRSTSQPTDPFIFEEPVSERGRNG